MEAPAEFHLEPAGPGSYVVAPIGAPEGRDVVYGGLLIAQMLLASHAEDPASDKPAASIHTVFARAASQAAPLEIGVDRMHDGRTVGADTVSVRQGDRLCARSLVLRQSSAADLIRHRPEMPAVEGPELLAGGGSGHASLLVAPGTELRIVGGVDTWDPDAPTGPAELHVWVKLPAWATSPVLRQAVLGYATDGFLIGTAMRPHAGLGQNMAHRQVATGVLAHTISFHQPVPADSWLLLAHEGTQAGGGRAYGRAQVFSAEGELVASVVQDSIIRGG